MSDDLKFKLPHDLHVRLALKAQAQGLSKADVVRLALYAYLNSPPVSTEDLA